MNSMSDKTFVDANVLIYAYDLDSGRKRQISNSILLTLWQEGSGVVSMQVLQEFYVNATRKLATPMARSAARSVVNDYMKWCMEATSDQISEAFRFEEEYKINFWDALIIAAAFKSGANRILSEDLNAGQRYAGILVENPFGSADC
jgi:predicted nucleic acid-binding protein